jgi:uncharacterized protein Yka (UPF0111/DUF47 family)
MNAIVQFDLFEPIPEPIELLRLDLEAVALSADKVRKGTYAEINRLKKRVLELESRLDIIEKNICKGIHDQAIK